METTAASHTPMVNPHCTKAIALARYFAGQVSVTSDAPEAYSPPMPKPTSIRKSRSWVAVCEKPQASVAIEYIIILQVMDFIRPYLSAKIPKAIPPKADANKAAEANEPA